MMFDTNNCGVCTAYTEESGRRGRLERGLLGEKGEIKRQLIAIVQARNV